VERNKGIEKGEIKMSLKEEDWEKVGGLTLKRIPREYREKILKEIEHLIELEYKQLEIIERMKRKTKQRIHVLNDIKKSRIPLVYLKILLRSKTG
jgi:coenzyme F420-reducing hydrogenase alpha subunit